MRISITVSTLLTIYFLFIFTCFVFSVCLSWSYRSDRSSIFHGLCPSFLLSPFCWLKSATSIWDFWLMESHGHAVTLPVCLFIYLLGLFSLCVCVCVVTGCQSNTISLADVDLLFYLSLSFTGASVEMNRLLGGQRGPSIELQIHTLQFQWLMEGFLTTQECLTVHKASPWSLKADTYTQDPKLTGSTLIIWIYIGSTCWKFHFMEIEWLYMWMNAPPKLGLFCFDYTGSTSAFLWLLIIVASHFWWFPSERMQNVAVVWH